MQQHASVCHRALLYGTAAHTHTRMEGGLTTAATAVDVAKRRSGYSYAPMQIPRPRLVPMPMPIPTPIPIQQRSQQCGRRKHSAPALHSDFSLLRVSKWACAGTAYMGEELLPPILPANHEGLRPSNSLQARDNDPNGYLELVQNCFRLPYQYQ